MRVWIGVWALCLLACQPTPSEKNDSPPAVVTVTTLSTTPWLFWEGELRVHVMQHCHDNWQVSSHDVWEQAHIPMPCDTEQKIRLTSQTINRELDENTPQWLALPSADHQKWLTVLKQQRIVADDGSWLWANGRIVLMAGLLNEHEHSLADLLFWHQLDQQAREQGGAVVVLLNHDDIAALGGDAAFNKAIQHHAASLQISVADLFGLASEWGRWLRQQNLAYKWNDTLFSNISWSGLDLDGFSDIDAVNRSLRLGLHTRFRRYTDPAVMRIFEHIDNAEPQTLNAEQWQSVQSQWLVSRWLTLQNSSLQAIKTVSDKAILWQVGVTTEIAI